MTLRADLAVKRRENPWIGRWIACGLLAVVNSTRNLLMPSYSWSWLPVFALTIALAVCCAMEIRTGQKLRIAREDAEMQAREAAAVLRTPRVPDAGPDQCPVCGGYGLDALAADDKLMERGEDRAQVVAWGRKRAHWACAEFVPCPQSPAEIELETHRRDHTRGRYNSDCRECQHLDDQWYREQARRSTKVVVPESEVFATLRKMESEPPLGVYWTCRFCGEQRHAFSAAVGEQRLIAHSKECPKRPRPTFREIKAGAAELDTQIADLDARVAAAAGRVSIDLARLAEVLRMLGKGY